MKKIDIKGAVVDDDTAAFYNFFGIANVSPSVVSAVLNDGDIGEDVEVIKNILHLSLESLNHNLEKFQTAITLQDDQKIKLLIHDIKGESLNIGLPVITDIIDKAEPAIRRLDYQTLSSIAAELKQSLHQIENIRKGLQ